MWTGLFKYMAFTGLAGVLGLGLALHKTREEVAALREERGSLSRQLVSSKALVGHLVEAGRRSDAALLFRAQAETLYTARQEPFTALFAGTAEEKNFLDSPLPAGVATALRLRHARAAASTGSGSGNPASSTFAGEAHPRATAQ